jgi:hypothetical protein
MGFGEKLAATILTVFFILLLLFGVAMAIPGSRKWINEYVFLLESVDQETDYQNRKNVEDTARAMIANYNARKLEFMQYKDAPLDSSDYRRAADAMTAANNIASTYNNYITQNNYIFKGNLPDDIPLFLPYIGMDQ